MEYKQKNTIGKSTKVRNPRKCQEYKLLKLDGAQGSLWRMAENGAKKHRIRL